MQHLLISLLWIEATSVCMIVYSVCENCWESMLLPHTRESWYLPPFPFSSTLKTGPVSCTCRTHWFLSPLLITSTPFSNLVGPFMTLLFLVLFCLHLMRQTIHQHSLLTLWLTATEMILFLGPLTHFSGSHSPTTNIFPTNTLHLLTFPIWFWFHLPFTSPLIVPIRFLHW